MTTPRVSDKDRAHFARVASAKRAEAVERAGEANETHPIARMIAGLALGHAGRRDEHLDEALDRRAYGQAELARRGRRLGRRGE